MATLFSTFYDLENPPAPKDELELYATHCAQAKGPILEAMCGTGRVLVPLRNMGFPVEGVDSSFHMLEMCRKKTSAPLHLQPLEELHLFQKYDLIFIPAKSLSLFPKHRLPLPKIYDHLRPGGTLIFDLWSSMNPMPTKIYETKQFGTLYSEKTFHYNPLTRSFSVEHRLEQNGFQERETYQIHFYEIEEIQALLKQAGFNLVKQETHRHIAKIESELTLQTHLQLECKVAAF